MKFELVREVIDCLPKGRTHFRYFKDGYAPRVLSLALPGEASVRAIRKSSVGKLLQTRLMKNVLSHQGNGLIDPATLATLWCEPSCPYLLSLSSWRFESRRWSQVSRAGDNLVLQLNLPQVHDRLYAGHVGRRFRFNPCLGHPVQADRGQHEFRNTLAWARIDLCFDTGEALIEELQSDAVRQMQYLARCITDCGCNSCQRQRRYLKWFAPYGEQWSEALLTASIEFIVNELGIRKIFTHTARSGWRVKKMDSEWQPPRSLYSTLPKKLAFQRVWNAPAFLLETRSYHALVRKQPDIDFYLLDLTWSDSNGQQHSSRGDGYV